MVRVFSGAPANEYPWVETCDGQSPTLTAHTAVANTAYLGLVRVTAPLLVSTIKTYIWTTVAGNIQAGIYELDAAGTTWSLIASSAAAAVAGSGTNQTFTLTTPVTLIPGRSYYLALASDAAVVLARINSTTGFASNGTPINRQVSKTTSYPLPSSITSPSAQAVMWAVGY